MEPIFVSEVTIGSRRSLCTHLDAHFIAEVDGLVFLGVSFGDSQGKGGTIQGGIGGAELDDLGVGGHYEVGMFLFSQF